MALQANKHGTARVPSSRFERTARTAALMMRIGGNAGGALLKDLITTGSVDYQKAVLTPHNLKATVQSLKHLRGAAMKLGQLMSIDDSVVLTPELSAILAELRASGYAMPPRQLKHVLDREWGAGWQTQFRSFNVRPIAAASIGQVHQAVLKTGERVAIKVQFPNVRETIESDVKTLVSVIKRLNLAPSSVDLEYYASQCIAQLQQETDYGVEANYMRRFAGHLNAHEGLSVPIVYDALTTKTILGMSFENGAPLETAKDWAQEDKNALALDMFELLLAEIFDFNLVQTDPNLANYLVDPANKSLTLLDFGACCEMSPSSIAIYHDLLEAGLTFDPQAVKHVMKRHGLMPDRLQGEMEHFVDELLAQVFQELSASPVFDFGMTRIFDMIDFNNINIYRDLLPPSNVPMDLLFTQRKIIGFVLFFKSLDAQIPVLDILTRLKSR